MKDLISSLSVGSGAILVGAASTVLVPLLWLCSTVFRLPMVVRWLWVVIVPFTLAYYLYWTPVWWYGADAIEYDVWKFLFIPAWFIAGAAPSALLVFVLQKHRAKAIAQDLL